MERSSASGLVLPRGGTRPGSACTGLFASATPLRSCMLGCLHPVTLGNQLSQNLLGRPPSPPWPRRRTTRNRRGWEVPHSSLAPAKSLTTLPGQGPASEPSAGSHLRPWLVKPIPVPASHQLHFTGGGLGREGFVSSQPRGRTPAGHGRSQVCHTDFFLALLGLFSAVCLILR